MLSDKNHQISADDIEYVDLLPRTGCRPNLDLMFLNVRDFLFNIGCDDGVQILEGILRQIRSRNRNYDAVMELQTCIDRTLSARFGIKGLFAELNNYWLDFLENVDSGIAYVLPIPDCLDNGLLSALLKFVGRPADRICDDKERMLVSAVLLACAGKVYRDDREQGYQTLGRFDECFRPFVSESPHPILEDIRHAFVHNRVWITDDGIRFVNIDKRNGIYFEYDATFNDFMETTSRVLDSIRGLDCSDALSAYLCRLPEDLEPFLRGRSGMSKHIYQRCLEMATVLVHETMWRSFDELFSNMKRRDMLERLVNEYLYGVDANVARNTLAHEWFWEPKVSGKWFLNGESNDRFLLRLLILSQAPFVEAAIIGIGEAVRFSEKAVPEEGQ